MKPILELVLKESPDKVVAVACGKCRIVKFNKEVAESCCIPRTCPCGVEIPLDSWRVVCIECDNKAMLARLANRVNKAKRVLESTTSGLYCECCDQHFHDSWELFEQHNDMDKDLPTWAWATYGETLSLDMEQIVRDRVDSDGFHEDVGEGVDYTQIQAQVDAWIEAQGLSSLMPSDDIVDLTMDRLDFLDQDAFDRDFEADPEPEESP